jgi:tetratricopeptide (TPR) repeat protein
VATNAKQDAGFLEQFEPDVFWQQHGQKIIWAAIGAAALAVVLLVWQRQKTQRAEEAAARLAVATQETALQGIIQDYPGQEVAASAMIRLGDLYFRTGRYAEAASVYQKLLATFPRHPLAQTAMLGLAAVQEAQGNFSAAKDQYLQLASSYPGGYASLAARMGAARCAELLGQIKEARQMYEELLPAAQGSPLQTEALVRWTVLSRRVGEAALATPQAETGPLNLGTNGPVSATGTLR